LPKPARKPLVIAVDGPAAAGKGTLARRLAAHFGLRHLDSGALYRALALLVLEGCGDTENLEQALAAVPSLASADLADPALREERVAQAASRLAARPEVRSALLGLQRRIAAEPPGAVIDGRDIGTVVCPEAPVKLFLDAAPETRACRRLKELQERGVEGIEERVLEEMKDRDRRDRERAVAPLVPAPDAFRIDTTGLDADAVFKTALCFVEDKIARL
jgi:cytidylate kinase